MKKNSKDILSKKSKAELLELAMQHNIPAYKKMNKSELVDSLLAQSQNKSQTEKEELIGQRAGRTGLWSKYHNHIYGLASLVGLVIAIYALNPGAEKGNGKAIVINDEIKEQRVAVVPFENRTGDSTLNILGVMSADWINQGLMDFEDIEVVSPFAIRANAQFLGTPQFAENTKAQNIITGNYYQKDEDLTFKLELIDAISGKVKIAFDDITGTASDKENMVTKLREKITGYWKAKDLVDDRRIAAPNLEAYELYNKAINGSKVSSWRLAADADTTFHFATINYIAINAHGYGANNPMYFQRLEHQIDNMTDYEHNMFEGIKAMHHGDRQKMFQNVNTLRKKYPHDHLIKLYCVVVAYVYMNNPELAVEIIEEVPITKQDQKALGFYDNFRLLIYANALIDMNELDKLTNYFKEHSLNIDIDPMSYYGQKYFAAIATNNNESNDLFNEVKDLWSPYWSTHWNRFNSDYPEQDRARLRQFMVKHSDKSQSRYLGSISAFEDAEDLSQKISELDIDITEHGIYFAIDFLYAIAEIAMGRKDERAVNLLLDKLLELSQTDRLNAPPVYGSAHAIYVIATIHAQLGDKTKAMDYLARAKEEGFFTGFVPYDKDVRLASLYELPEFKELTKPIWPEVKD